MYGMLLESVQHFIQEEYGEKTWSQILTMSGHHNIVFTTHQNYSDDLMLKIADTCSRVTGTKSSQEFLRFFGRCFVRYFSHYGYDRIVRASGRNFRDFLHGVDNIHSQMHYSYPRMISPSLNVEQEDAKGVVLHYRSTREGFSQYLIGQLEEVAENFFTMPLAIRVLNECKVTHSGGGVIVQYRLDFKNDAFVHSHHLRTSLAGDADHLPPVTGPSLLQLFPFCIVFDSNLSLKYVGNKLKPILDKQIIGLKINDHFRLRRPRIEFTWENILSLWKVVCELEAFTTLRIKKSTPLPHPRDTGTSYKSTTLPPVQETKFVSCICTASREPQKSSTSKHSPHEVSEQTPRTLLLKGQMRYIEEWKAVIFLCVPLINDLEEMSELQLYLNDLSLHDLSREMVLIGWQHTGRLVHAYEKQEERSKQVEKNLRLLDEWKQKGDDLLYSMIPRSVANRLRTGENPINTCTSFDEVSILFSQLVGFDEMCAAVHPMETVASMNRIFTLFDEIIDKYNVYKVETIGTVYMLVGGAPQEQPDHLLEVGQSALSIIRTVQSLGGLSSGDKIVVRAGIHVGPVVAGVVGMKTLRYCFFGDTVNTASRMQSNSLPGKILVSEPCYRQLTKLGFQTEFRGIVNIKGKGSMKTYWLTDYSSPDTSL